LFMVIGVIDTGILTLFVTGMAYGAWAMYTWLGFGIGFVIVALLFAGVDAAIVAWVRAMRRRIPHPPDIENL
ncbi:MAG TPA: hypothetical protein VFQ25_11730, partial [Ktedonobacterales bacterium]|nr:hypothetical protein [Ktedonobacterales bacterium]